METKVLGRNPPSPLKPDEGPNLTTHRLAHEGSVWVFRPAGFARIFPRVFTIFGYLFIVAAVVTVWQSLFNSLAALCGGALAIGVGRFIANNLGNGARFDSGRRRVEIPEQPTLKLRFDASPATTLIDFAEVSELEIVHKRVAATNRARRWCDERSAGADASLEFGERGYVWFRAATAPRFWC